MRNRLRSNGFSRQGVGFKLLVPTDECLQRATLEVDLHRLTSKVHLSGLLVQTVPWIFARAGYECGMANQFMKKLTPGLGLHLSHDHRIQTEATSGTRASNNGVYTVVITFCSIEASLPCGYNTDPSSKMNWPVLQTLTSCWSTTACCFGLVKLACDWPSRGTG